MEKYFVRRPYRYGSTIYMPGDGMPVSRGDVKLLQSRGIIGSPFVEPKPVKETAMAKPPEDAMQPKAEPKPAQRETRDLSDMTVSDLRSVLKAKGLSAEGKKAELIERLGG